MKTRFTRQVSSISLLLAFSFGSHSLFASDVDFVSELESESEESSPAWSISYGYIPGSQPVISDSSEKTIQANYHSLSLDGSTDNWSWGINAGKSSDDDLWEDGTLDESAKLSIQDRGFYLSRNWGNWSLSASVNYGKSSSGSYYTRHFPNRNQDYILVDVEQSIAFSELSLGARLSWGQYLDEAQTWYLSVDVASKFHDAESTQVFRHSNQVLATSPALDTYIRENPIFTPGTIRSDEVSDNNEFWSREVSLSLDKDIDFEDWLYTVSLWGSYLHYGAPEGSLTYSRSARGTRPLSRSIKYDANEQLISADSIGYFGIDNYFTITPDITLSIGISDSNEPQAKTSYSFNLQYWF